MATGEEKEIVTIDTDLLNCSICYEPLCPPVSQCTNGHVACTSCWSKLQHKCHICKVPVVSRNIAIDNILESVHLPCTCANLEWKSGKVCGRFCLGPSGFPLPES